MKAKNRRRTAMVLLSLMLATTGCKREEVNIKEGYEEKIESFLDRKYHYTSNSIFTTNKDYYEDFYYKFFCMAIDNMTDEEYEEFSEELDNLLDYNHSIDTLLYYVTSMLKRDNDEFGHGFYSMFNYQLKGKEVGPLWYLERETFAHINTLRTIVNDDEKFFASVLSRDIDKVIDCIYQNTQIKDRILVEELILKLDQYYEIYDSTDYQNQKLKSMYETRIQEIMNTLVQTKCAYDQEFDKTLYAAMLKESKYFRKNEITIYQELLGLNAGFSESNYGTLSYSMNVPYTYLLSDISIEEAKTKNVEMEISNVFDKDTADYEKEFFDLIVLLLDRDALGKSSSDEKRSVEIRALIYENLKDHFKDEDEFNSFILSFIEGNPSAQKFYLRLFNERLSDDGIEYYDFIRYTALANYINASTITHYREREANFDFTLDVTYGDLIKMTKEEYEEYVHTYYENFLFNWEVDYQKYLEEGAEILANNDLGYEAMYNPECSVNWEYGYLSPRYVSPLVISEKISPKAGKYNGANVIYYEYPEFYEDGEALDTFINIEDAFTTRTIPGFKVEITDNNTGDVKYIYIVSIGGKLEEFGDAHFGTFYYNFNKKKDAKELSLGGNNE